MNEVFRRYLELYARLLRAMIASNSKDARTIAKAWLVIIEDEITDVEQRLAELKNS